MNILVPNKLHPTPPNSPSAYEPQLKQLPTPSLGHPQVKLPNCNSPSLTPNSYKTKYNHSFYTFK
jgi:hypothetical protein